MKREQIRILARSIEAWWNVNKFVF